MNQAILCQAPLVAGYYVHSDNSPKTRARTCNVDKNRIYVNYTFQSDEEQITQPTINNTTNYANQAKFCQASYWTMKVWGLPSKIYQ